VTTETFVDKQLLTTVIPVYNGERYLADTLQSVAGQTRPSDRVVVLDNCSTDNTRAVFENFRGHGFEWKQNETNIGLTGNLNRALDYAPLTDCLHILLADDLIKPTFYERLLNALKPLAGRGIAYTPFEIIDENGALQSPATPEKQTPERLIHLDSFLQAQAELQTILIPAVLLKTNRLPSPSRLPLDMPQVGDCLFYAEWGLHCERIIEIPEFLCQYRRHSSSTTDRNLWNLQAWVLDEWKIMQTVSALRPGTKLKKWITQQRLKCLFAARAKVKVQMVAARDPEYAMRIRATARKISGPLCSTAGNLAVVLRDMLAYVKS
jgi:hypothetical protein